MKYLGFDLKSNSVNTVAMDLHFEQSSDKWEMVADYIRDVCKANPVITSAKDSTHSKGSEHPFGRALDLRISDWKGDVEHHAKVIAWILGEPWVVVAELKKLHLHIQAGMRNIINPNELVSFGGGMYVKSKA